MTYGNVQRSKQLPAAKSHITEGSFTNCNFIFENPESLQGQNFATGNI